MADAEGRRSHRAGPAAGRVKMAEVAQAAGVSPASVSRALKDPESVSPDILARVHAAADRLGYSRNRIASSMAGARTPIIAIIVPTLTNAFFSRTIQSISGKIAPLGHQLMIGVHEYDQAQEESLIQSFLDWNPMALIVTGLHHSRGSTALLARAPCPVIEMWDYDKRPIDSVIGCSMDVAGRMVARHLIQKGRRNLIFAGHMLDRDPRAAARAAAFLGEVERYPEVTAEVLSLEGRNADAGYKMSEVIRRDHPDADGVAFSGDLIAIGALAGFSAMGVRVPEDIAVIGYGDLDPSGFSQPPLTTLRPPHHEMGAEVARHLLARLENPDHPSEMIDLGFRLIERATT